MQDSRSDLHNTRTVDDDLIFLATTNNLHCRQRLDKTLVGYATMQHVTLGSVRVGYEERWFTLEPRDEGWFFPAYPGPRLRFHAAEEGGFWHHRHVGFQGPRLARWIAEGLWPTEPQPAPDGRGWPERFDELIAHASRDGLWARRRGINLLEGLLLELAEARTERATSVFLSRVLSELSTEATFAPDYAALAQKLGVSVSTLRRRFKLAMNGQTLHDYVIGRRIMEARALLLETDLPLHKIAERLGYESEFFFARQFKQCAGVTASDYRRSRLFVAPQPNQP